MAKALKLTVNDYTDEEVKEFDSLRVFEMNLADMEFLKLSNAPEDKIERYKAYKDLCFLNYKAAELRDGEYVRQRLLSEFSTQEKERFPELLKAKLLDPRHEFESIRDARLFKEIMIAIHIAGPRTYLQ